MRRPENHGNLWCSSLRRHAVSPALLGKNERLCFLFRKSHSVFFFFNSFLLYECGFGHWAVLHLFAAPAARFKARALVVVFLSCALPLSSLATSSSLLLQLLGLFLDVCRGGAYFLAILLLAAESTVNCNQWCSHLPNTHKQKEEYL